MRRLAAFPPLVRRLALAGVLGVSAPLACVPISEPESPELPQEADWNGQRVKWQPYDEGLALARETKRPVVLVLYTDWCPHCHNYARVFHDDRLVELARRFVMVRVERDSHPQISALYDLDGQYIPRTFFLRPDASIMRELNGGRSRFLYYLSEHEPDELLALMRRALELAPLTPAGSAPDLH